MKKLWMKNRVVVVLLIILLICFIAIVGVTITFFYSKDVSEYGTRLEDISKHPVDDKFKNEYKDKVLENENVTKVTMNIKGRIIYVHIDFNEVISLDDAKNIATTSLEMFNDDIKSYYDIEFVLKSDNFTIFGAKNSKIDHVSWNNNKPVPTVEEGQNEE